MLACALMLGAGATVAFANVSADIDQCANGSAVPLAGCDQSSDWINGDLNPNAATYAEGDSVPYRAKLGNLVAGHTYHLAIQWDTTKSSKHAIDFITSYGRTSTTQPNYPCVGYLVTSCTDPSTATSLYPIPLDAMANQTGGTGIGAQDRVNASDTYPLCSQYANCVTPSSGDTSRDRQFLAMWGGTITGVSPYTDPVSYTGDTSTSITISFTATGSSAVLSWGGHVAERLDWGALNGAASISGSPYHMRLLSMTSDSANEQISCCGNQDRAMKTSAVQYPALITVTKQTSEPTTTPFQFDNSFSARDENNQNDFVSPFYLVTDSPATFPANTYLSSVTYKSTDFGTDRTITETEPASGLWFPDSAQPLDCTHQNPLGTGGYTVVSNQQVSLNLTQADSYSCTFHNKKKQATSLTTNAGSSFTVGTGGTQTLSDTATLSGGTSNATGTITFSLYADDGNGGCTGSAIGSSTATVDHADGAPTYSSGAATTGSYDVPAGAYHWVASYSGDTDNSSSDSPCGSDNENPVVSPRDTQLTTDAGGPYPVGGSGTMTLSDTATLSGGTSNATGTITFSLYADDGNGGCTGSALGSSTVTVDHADGAPTYDSGAATSGSYDVPAGTYHWVASYDGDSNNSSSDSPCGSDHENPVVTPGATDITTQLSDTQVEVGASVHDTASLSGTTANAGGHVTYTVYSDSNCASNAQDAGTKAVTNGAVPDSNPITFTKGGTYYWQAVYSGDANNVGSTSPCTEEQLTVVGLSIDKTADNAQVETGSQIGFKVTVTGTGPATGVTLNDPLPAGPSGNALNWSIPAGGVTGAVVPSCSITGAVGHQTLACSAVNLGGGSGGATAQSYSVHVVSATATGGSAFTANNTATASASNHGNVQDSATVIVHHPVIAIAKAGPATATAGDKVSYVLTVTNPGDEGLTNVNVSDPQCNGDPVTLVSKNGDTTPGSLDPGDTWTFTCSVQTQAGDSSIQNVATVQGTDPLQVVVSSAGAATTTLAAQLVLPERITPGAARLAGPTGCTAKAFNARVRGTKIATVTFVLDGKVIKRVKNTKNAKVIQLRINPAKLRLGVHRLVVNVTFAADSKTKPKTMRLSFQRCGKHLVTPRFTG